MRALLGATSMWMAVVGLSLQAADRPDWRWLIVADGPTAGAEREALVGALSLLPRLPRRVVVIDATGARPEVRPTLARLDAFVTAGSPVVYVVRQSRLLRGAVDGSALHTHALAAVVWHEMAHVDGADEREARAREQALWTTFVRDQRVDHIAALRYLAALDRRPDDAVLAAR
jgi:hypothetical protein